MMALNDILVIEDYPENITEAAKMLKKLDIIPKQVLVEATIALFISVAAFMAASKGCSPSR